MENYSFCAVGLARLFQKRLKNSIQFNYIVQLTIVAKKDLIYKTKLTQYAYRDIMQVCRLFQEVLE